jgi:uncharacterized protein YsxB (DUF464 family)
VKTLIEVLQHNDGITIIGHANYAPIGQDIVCAGVSTLVQTLIQSIEDMTEDKIEYSMQPGMVEIKYRNLSTNAQLLVSSFFVGVNLIAETYPTCVRIV